MRLKAHPFPPHDRGPVRREHTTSEYRRNDRCALFPFNAIPPSLTILLRCRVLGARPQVVRFDSGELPRPPSSAGTSSARLTYLEPNPPAYSLLPAHYSLPADPAPELSSMVTLSELHGHVSAITLCKRFHVFETEEAQLRLARTLASLLSPQPGSMIVGLAAGAHVRYGLPLAPEMWDGAVCGIREGHGQSRRVAGGGAESVNAR
ncbi:hypothetical protein C8T65DRAFT_28339 [Cerioporus squamosus]|nr:hypothetical protein C8T65DRAFT_28339 [Cerioporus squamosus]